MALTLEEKKATLLQKERKLAQQKANLRELERKRDARHKIELGGLIVKAGIANWDASTLLGLLVSAKESVEKDQAYLGRWQTRGKAIFDADEAAKTSKKSEKQTQAAPAQPKENAA